MMKISAIEKRRIGQEEVDKNYDYFRSNLAKITAESSGRSFVLLHKQKAIGYFDTRSDAKETACIMYKDKNLPFSIQEVADKPVELGYQAHALF